MTQQVAIMPMRKTLDTLAKTAATLNTKTDQLNEIVADVEQEFQAAGVGVTVWLNALLDSSSTERRYQANDDEQQWPIDVTFGWELGFAKVEGEWRISARYVRHEQSGDDVESFEERAPIPLVKAPRIVRVEAAPLLETLAEVTNTKMEAYIKGIERAQTMAKEGDPPDEKLVEVLNERAKSPDQGNWLADLMELAMLAGFATQRAAAEAAERLRKRNLIEQVDDGRWQLAAHGPHAVGTARARAQTEKSSRNPDADLLALLEQKDRSTAENWMFGADDLAGLAQIDIDSATAALERLAKEGKIGRVTADHWALPATAARLR
jgi:hypothetical protein